MPLSLILQIRPQSDRLAIAANRFLLQPLIYRLYKTAHLLLFVHIEQFIVRKAVLHYQAESVPLPVPVPGIGNDNRYRIESGFQIRGYGKLVEGIVMVVAGFFGDQLIVEIYTYSVIVADQKLRLGILRGPDACFSHITAIEIEMPPERRYCAGILPERMAQIDKTVLIHMRPCFPGENRVSVPD